MDQVNFEKSTPIFIFIKHIDLSINIKIYNDEKTILLYSIDYFGHFHKL
jgi:hypothetical protein